MTSVSCAIDYKAAVFASRASAALAAAHAAAAAAALAAAHTADWEDEYQRIAFFLDGEYGAYEDSTPVRRS